jgi:hypothetical protein
VPRALLLAPLFSWSTTTPPVTIGMRHYCILHTSRASAVPHSGAGVSQNAYEREIVSSASLLVQATQA